MLTIKLVSVAALIAVVALASPLVCQAQSAVPAYLAATAPAESTAPAASSSKAVVEDAKKAEEEAKKSWVSGEVGIALTNAYIFNGLIQDKDTIIAQPYVTLNFMLYEGEGFLSDASFTLPFWASIHDINRPRPVNGSSSLKDWYELDISPGFSFTFAKNWSFTISDYIYTSPGDYFDTSHNLSLALEYDDSDLLGAFALHPHFYFQQELTSHAGLAYKNGIAYASDAPKGQYYEFGIAPGHTFAEKATYPVSISFPTSAGFGSSGFFGQGFGYFSTGAEVSIPLAFIPESYGSWTTSVSGRYYRLGSTAAFYTNSGDPDQGVFSWTLGTEF
ncbi:MAG: hypothetical protein ABI674_00715 [Spartobacteria bacterium]